MIEESAELILKLNRPKKFKKLEESIENGNEKLTKLLLEDNQLIFFIRIEYTIYQAMINNHFHVIPVLVDYFKKKADYDSQFICMCGLKDQIEQAIELYQKYRILINTKEALYSAAISGNLAMAKFLVEDGEKELDYALKGACKGGRKEIVEYFYEKGCRDFHNYTFEYAVSSANRELIDYIISIGDLTENDYNDGMYGAIKAKFNKELLELMVKNGASDFDYGLDEAGKEGNLEMVKYFISLGATDIKRGFSAASYSGNREVLEFLMEKGVTEFDILHGICEHNDKSLVDFFIEKGADINDGISGATQGDNMEMLKYVISKGATNYSSGLFASCMHGNMEMTKYLISKGARNLSPGFRRACRDADLEMVKYLVERGADNFDDGIYHSCQTGNIEVFDYLISKGASNFSEALETICDQNNIHMLHHLAQKYKHRIESKDALPAILTCCSANNFFHSLFLLLFYFRTDVTLSHDEQTPLESAQNSDSLKCIEFLQDFIEDKLFTLDRYLLFPSHVRKNIFDCLINLHIFSQHVFKKKIPKPLIHIIINQVIKSIN